MKTTQTIYSMAAIVLHLPYARAWEHPEIVFSEKSHFDFRPFRVLRRSCTNMCVCGDVGGTRNRFLMQKYLYTLLKLLHREILF